MSEVTTRSRETMEKMFGKKSAAEEMTFPLQEIQNNNLEIFLKELSSLDRSYLGFLARSLSHILEDLISAMGEEEASRFLYNAFGLPDQEILELATPVHLELLSRLKKDSAVIEKKTYVAKESLLEIMEEIERTAVASLMQQQKQLEKDIEKCRASLREVEESDELNTENVKNNLEWKIAHQKKIIGINKDIERNETAMFAWLKIIANLENIYDAASMIRHKDITVPNPELVYQSNDI